MLSSMCFPACCRATTPQSENNTQHGAMIALKIAVAKIGFYTQRHTSLPLLRSSSSSSSSFFVSFSLSFSLSFVSVATHWISPDVSCHSPLWSWGFGASLMRSSVCASANMAARSRSRKNCGRRKRQTQNHKSNSISCVIWPHFSVSYSEVVM